MFPIRFTLANFAALKLGLRSAFPQVRSAHADEALAAGLGFRTYAALLSSLKTKLDSKQILVVPDETLIAERLNGMSYGKLNVAKALEKLPLPDLWLNGVFSMDPSKVANQNISGQ